MAEAITMRPVDQQMRRESAFGHNVLQRPQVGCPYCGGTGLIDLPPDSGVVRRAACSCGQRSGQIVEK